LAAGSTYLGGGEIGWLHDFIARSKKYNLLESGKATELGHIDFLVNKTDSGEFNVDIYANNNNHTPVNVNDIFFNTTVSTQPYDSDMGDQDKLIHRLFSRVHAQFIQYEINLTPIQKVTSAIHDSDIEIYALTLWLEKSGRIVQ
jgi:hypothetical protein